MGAFQVANRDVIRSFSVGKIIFFVKTLFCSVVFANDLC